MFCAYCCIFKANFLYIYWFFLHIFCISYDIYTYLLHFGHTNAYLCIFQSAGPLQGPALGLSDSIPVPLHSNNFISLMISTLYCPNTLVSGGQVNLAPARALGPKSGGRWAVHKIRGLLSWDNPCQSASPSWETQPLWVCHETESQKIIIYMQNMPPLTGEIMKIQFYRELCRPAAHWPLPQSWHSI